MENWEKVLEELFTGVMGMSDPTVWVMFAIGAVLIWLGVKKDYEPMLLFPMGVGCILANIPGHFAVIPTDGGEPGFLSVLYLSLIHISEPTRLRTRSRMPSSA